MNNSKENLINTLINIEWEEFDKVDNIGGRASCQDDRETFSIMRKSQYLTWNEEMLQSYIDDFNTAKSEGRNLISEKYGRMMKSTSPQEYDKIKEFLPKLSTQTEVIINQIATIQVNMMEKFAIKYPNLASNARDIHSSSDTLYNTSYETYLKGELGTYSPKTLKLYGNFIVETGRQNKNLAEMIMQNTINLYGYESLEQAENKLN